MFEGYLLATSIWITPIPLDAQSISVAVGSLNVGLDTWISPDVWSIPAYNTSSSDPTRALLYNSQAWYMVANGSWKRYGNSSDVERVILSKASATFPYSGNVYSSTSPYAWTLPADFNKTINPPALPARFSVGANNVPAAGSDGHMAVMQPDGRVLETYGTIILSSGQVIALSYSVSSSKSRGDGWQNGQTASMLPSYLGVTDDAEVLSGVIGHAMAITVPAGLLATKTAYPAYAFDRDAATASPAYSGNVPMGTRLGLPKKVDLASLGLATIEGKAIAKAAQVYGFIVVDRGGSGVSIRIRKNPKVIDALLHRWNWGLQSDLNRLMPLLVRF